MLTDVIVIGGGLSGLSAAVDLCTHGRTVKVLEQRHRCGGRAYSYIDKKTGDSIDNGQHLLMGCFENTKHFLKTIGSLDKLTIQKNLEVMFYLREKGFITFRCPSVPSPFHIVLGILQLNSLTLRDRLRLLWLLLQVGTRNKPVAITDSMTVDEWLTSCNQTEECKKYFWNVIATATLNEPPQQAAASLFVKVLREAFLNGRDSSVLMIPNKGLSDLYVDDSERFICQHNGEVIYRARVRRIIFSTEGAVGVELINRRRLRAKAIISSVPLVDLLGIMPKQFDSLLRDRASADELTSSGIITINLWLDRRVTERDFVSLPDSPVQWVFNKDKLLHRGRKEVSYLSCVISGAGPMLTWQKDRLVRLATEEVRQVFPEARTANVVHSLVVKEKRATLSSSPEVQRHRLPATTPWKNFLLAGDWTDTGLPSTIESAVTSGFSAARLVREYLEGRS